MGDASPEKSAGKADAPVGRVLGLSALAVFVTSLFMRAVDPVIPQIAGDFVIDPHTAALVATAFSLPYAITQPLLGGLADAFGKIRLMIWSLFVLVIAAALGAAAWSYPALLGSRAISGVVAGGVFPITVAIVADRVSVERRQIEVGRILGAAMIGNVLGSRVAGAAGDVVGWRGVFVGMGVLAAIALVAALIGFRGHAKETQTPVQLRALPLTYAAIFRNPLAKICYSAVMIEAICLFGLFPYMASLLQAGGEPRAAIAGIVIAGFGVGGIIYASTVSLLLPRFGERRLMISGGTLMGVALAAVALRLPWPLATLVFVLLGLGFYMLHAVIQIYASELAPAARGSAMALHSTSFFLGNAIGPIVYGAALPTVGLAATVVTCGAILIGVGLVCAYRLRRG